MSEAAVFDGTQDKSCRPILTPPLEVVEPLSDTTPPRLTVEQLMSPSYEHGILQDKHTTRVTKTSQLAARTLDVAASIFEHDSNSWPGVHEFEEKYGLAGYLWQTRDIDETAILLEIMDEAFEEAPELYQAILGLSEKIAKRMKLYSEAQVAHIMVKLWVVDETEPDLPSSYEKTQKRAHARATQSFGFTSPQY